MGRTAGVLFPVGEKFFSSPQRPYRLWGPSSGLQGLFPQGQSGRVAKLIIHLLHLVPKSTTVKLYHALLELYLINYAQRRVTFSFLRKLVEALRYKPEVREFETR
jgi:hypothetical protein